MCLIKSPWCTDKNSKNMFNSDFPSPCFDVPKTWNFTSSGVQTRKTKNRWLGMIVMSFQDLKFLGEQISPTFSYFLINNVLWYHFLANSLAHNKKMTEKSVFLHNYSQSPVFGLAVSKTEVKFHIFDSSTHGEGKWLLNVFCFAIFTIILWRFYRAKKKCVIYTLKSRINILILWIMCRKCF